MAVKLKTLAQVTVATAGTEVVLTASHVQYVVKLLVSVPTANTGNMFLGDSDVAATRGLEIIKGAQPVEISAPNGEFLDLTTIKVDSANNGDKLNVAYVQKVVG